MAYYICSHFLSLFKGGAKNDCKDSGVQFSLSGYASKVPCAQMWCGNSAATAIEKKNHKYRESQLECPVIYCSSSALFGCHAANFCLLQGTTMPLPHQHWTGIIYPRLHFQDTRDDQSMILRSSVSY